MKGEVCEIQNDGTALEINTTPMATEDAFVANFDNSFKELQDLLQKKDDRAFPVITPVAYFGKKCLESVPKEVRRLGCRPDYCAWTEELNPEPDGDKIDYRTASGHIHLGWTENAKVMSEKHFLECSELVRELDYYVGCMSLLWDMDDTRRKVYGRAGAFRPKAYGLEYRTLSNAWCRRKSLARTVFKQTKRCFDHWYGVKMKTWSDTLLQDRYGAYAEAVINEGFRDWPDDNPELARDIYLSEFFMNNKAY